MPVQLTCHTEIPFGLEMSQKLPIGQDSPPNRELPVKAPPMSQRRPYPSDLSDARWALIEPTLTAWRQARLDRRPTGQPATVDLRDVFNAILYVNRTGIPWKYLPHDFPSHNTVYFYYAAWRDEGLFTRLNYDLTSLARVKQGRNPEPTASIIDTQSVKTSTNVPLASQGTDAAKRSWAASEAVAWR